MACYQLLFIICFALVLNSTDGTNISNYLIFLDHHSTTTSLYDELEWLNDRVFYNYEVFKGFAARLTEGEAHFIANKGGVTIMVKDQVLVRLHTTRSPEFLGLNVDYGLWPETQFANDVIVAIVDTGIWPEAESFNDAGLGPVPSRWKGYCESGPDFNSSLCNRKLIGAKFFTKGFENLQSNEYHSPRDVVGHGTHTASIAVGAPVQNANLFGFANGTARGIATNARIAMYKACVMNGCSDSDILAAMESAIQDGVHVLSLSLAGYGSPYYADPIARGGFAAMERGIFVACAAGNNGPDLYSVKNTAPWLTTAGAGSIDRAIRVDVLLGDGKYVIGSSLYSSSNVNTVNSTLVYIGICDSVQETPYDFITKIVVCQVGTYETFDNAQAIKVKGGVGMIQLNQQNMGETLEDIAFPLPAVRIGFYEGVVILSYMNRSVNPTASFKFNNDQQSIGKERAPALASFSGRGPNPIVSKILKPDIIGPGVNILAAFPPNIPITRSLFDPRRSSFNIMSGTSMACPHVAGTAALLRAAHPDWSPAAIRSAMMTTARTGDNRGLPIANDGKRATPLGIGSGYINPEQAVDPGLIYDADISDYITFLCSLNYTEEQMRLFVATPHPCSGNVGSPGDLNYPSFSVVLKPGNNFQELIRTVTCVGKTLPEVYRVTIDIPKTEKVTIKVEPHTLAFKRFGEKQKYKVKFESVFIAGNISNLEEEMVFGSLYWVSDKHIIRSPIAIMWSTTNPVDGSQPYILKNVGHSLWHK
ncbi:hypothetical protein U1Q18_007674 [Sarracenia purpurea var. burkii]